MHPHVDMRIAAEVPDHVGTFELPNVPNAVVADVLVFVEGHVQLIEPAASM